MPNHEGGVFSPMRTSAGGTLDQAECYKHPDKKPLCPKMEEERKQDPNHPDDPSKTVGKGIYRQKEGEWEDANHAYDNPMCKDSQNQYSGGGPTPDYTREG